MHESPALGLDTADPHSCVHREPVLDTDERVIGYSITVVLDLPDGTVADTTEAIGHGGPLLAETLHEQYLLLDLPQLVSNRYAFLPATPQMLAGLVPRPHVPGRLVLDLPAGFELDELAGPRMDALRAQGIELTLADFTASPQQVALLGDVAFVTIDPRNLSQPLEEVVRTAHLGGAQVLAGGVQDLATQSRCIRASVDGFRGGKAERDAAAERPAKVLRPGQLQCLTALHLLHQPDVDLDKVAKTIDTDPVLTLRMLHLVNSGAFGLSRPVDTVRRAVVLLGTRETTALVAGLALDARPGAMDSLWHILARALTCEAIGRDPAGYTVGMLSALIEELGVPASFLLERVGVSSVVSQAILRGEGELGHMLQAVIAHERRDPATVAAFGYVPAEVSRINLDCLGDALATAKAAEGS
jgi:c-di-GMP-related signal transduction protein